MKSIIKKNYSRLLWFFIFSVVIMICGSRVYDIALIRNSDGFLALSTLVLILGMSLFIAFIVFTSILLFKCWHSIQETSSLRAGKAVGFLFIPFFNFYWIFIGLSSFPSELRKYCQLHQFNTVKIPNSKLSIIANILWIISLCPRYDLGILVFVGTILYLIFFYQCAKAVEVLELVKEFEFKQEAEIRSKELESFVEEEEIE